MIFSKTKLFVLICLVAGFSCSATAAVKTLQFGDLQVSFDPSLSKNKNIASWSEVDQFSYLYTFQVCSEGATIDHTRLMRESITSSLNEVSDLMFLDTKSIKERMSAAGLSPIVDVLLKSVGMPVALNECYGNDEWKKNLYVSSLILSDNLGVFSGYVASTLGANAVFKGAGSIAYKIFQNPLRKTGTFIARYVHLGKKAKIGLSVLGAGGTLGLSYWMYEDELKMRAEAAFREEQMFSSRAQLLEFSQMIDKVKKSAELRTLSLGTQFEPLWTEALKNDCNRADQLYYRLQIMFKDQIEVLQRAKFTSTQLKNICS